ncbi:Dehydrogenase (flavoprotein) [Micromonospora pallida]|uniref:Dehydrogenase (Flavoprotein) n=1 Tax=Micromonospora pallida TaxID=145854 RepID=A0A1C6RJ22_9ACTN|nr:NAD(P)/FAD-dependent oxidoreductase [Micromonospora pallida]SCL17168.1 Dehydrogenase (flavoprotein) [Micromonospora pallida]
MTVSTSAAPGPADAVPDLPRQVDVVIVGARCAGAPLATLLARAGRTVALVDRAERIGNTLSSHIMQADTLRFLDRLGVLPDVLATGAPPFVAADTRLEDFHELLTYPGATDGPGGGICVRRQVLDPLLLAAARRAGVRPVLGAKVTDLLTGDGRVTGVRLRTAAGPVEIAAKLVVGADGRQSTVARLVGARRYHVVPGTRAYHWSYFADATPAGPPTFVFHRWGDQFVLGAPADNGLYLVGTAHTLPAGGPAGHRCTAEDFLADATSCPPVAQALAGAHRVAGIFGLTGFEGYFRDGAGPGWVLLGDAGHFKDPAAGRGIGDAFRQVDALAAALPGVLDGPVRDLDAATAAFARWRDREFLAHYWVGSDLGRAGEVPTFLPEIIQRMTARGQGSDLLAVLSHDVQPDTVLSPGRAVGAVGRLLAGGRVPRRRVLAEFGAALGDQFHRARLVRRPRHEAATAPTVVAGASTGGYR